jgi:transcriptional regulator with XRE-family HTH domain
VEISDTPQLRGILARRDITALYQALKAAGWSHARIASATGQSVSQVSEILSGRQVMAYDLLVRICEGLDIPRGWMGLAYDDITEEERKPDELDEDVKRRVMFGVASLALFGAPVLGEILELPKPSPASTPLPSRLASSDVRALRGCTQALRAGARSLGGGGQPVSEVATKGLRLLAIPADDDVTTDLKSALAELHTLAGWTCVDSGLHDAARYHFAKAMDLGLMLN